MTDASVGDFLSRLAGKLDAAGVPHMVVGSLASSYHGVPRSSQDLDLVVSPDPGSLQRFVADLPPEQYYADADAAREALRTRGQFNVIDMTTAWKADLIVRKARPFSVEELSRRARAEIAGAQAFVASAEDTILSKLEWAARGGGSELQLRDARGIVEVRGVTLDLAYLDRWARELGLTDLWVEARRGLCQ
jgi:hypothetical protein